MNFHQLLWIILLVARSEYILFRVRSAVAFHIKFPLMCLPQNIVLSFVISEPNLGFDLNSWDLKLILIVV